MGDTKRTITIEINGKEVEDSLQGIGKEIGRINRELRKTSDPSERRKLNKELQVARKRYSEIKQEINETAKEIQNAQAEAKNLLSAFSDIWSGFRSGNPLLVKQGFDEIKTGIKGATRAALAFIATPIGATLAILAGIVGVTKLWRDYNESIKESSLLVEQLTKITGDLADNIRIRTQSITDTFGGDFKENLDAAFSLVNDFGISWDEAFDIIEDGLVRGGSANEEFLESLTEYDTFFARAQFSANEFRKVINAGFDLGIYKDKLPDAIKEFVLSIEEQTKASTEALTNAFGESFTEKLLNDVKNGSITAKEALERVANEAKEVGLNAQQAQQLTADLFRGAGEDAGGALKIFEAVNSAFSEQERALSPLEEQLKRTAEANLELAKAQDEALKSDSYVTFSNDLSIFWKKVKTLFFEGVKFAVETFNTLGQELTIKLSQSIVIIRSLPRIFGEAFKKIKDNVIDLVKTFGGLSEVLGALFEFRFDDARKAFSEFKDNFKREFSEVKDSATGVLDEIQRIKDSVREKLELEFERKAEGSVQQAIKEDSTPIRDNQGISPEEIKLREARQKAEEKAIAERKKREEEYTAFLKEQRLKREIDGANSIAAILLKERNQYNKFLELQNLSEEKRRELQEDAEKQFNQIILLKKKELFT